MLGIEITKESVLAELGAMERELRTEIQSFAKNRLLPKMPDVFQTWVERHERRLVTIDVLRMLVAAQYPDGAVLLKEGEEPGEHP